MKTKKTDTAKFRQAEFDRKDHWETIYSDKKSTEVSWYQQNPETSLALIEATGLDKSARIIDIGGGASTLVDFLLSTGYQDITVLDIARSAIEQAGARLAQQADKVKWIEHDITTFKADGCYDIWYDRAVFHFLTDASDRALYIETVARSLESGAHAIIATFNLDGPEKCSGLTIVRYSPETLSVVFGNRFKLIETRTEKHITPGGGSQSFVYCHFIKI